MSRYKVSKNRRVSTVAGPNRPDMDFSVMGQELRGRVEDNNDPLRLGRVRVRVPQLHGVPGYDDPEEVIGVDGLPWVFPKWPSASAHDYGTFTPPPVGSYVMVSFETNSQRLYYTGVVHGKGPKNSKQMGSFVGSSGRWFSPAGDSEVPKDAFAGKSDDKPTRDVLFKSIKGHTIVMDNTDEEEAFYLIDRTGQVVGFVCPVTRSVNQVSDASFQRGTRSVVDETQMDHVTSSVGTKAVIFLKGLCNGILRIVSKLNGEKAELVARDKSLTRDAALVLRAGSDISCLLLAEDKGTNNKVFLRGDAKNSTLELVVVQGGQEVNKIALVGGSSSWVQTGAFTLKAPRVNENPSSYPPLGSSSVTWVDEKDELIGG